MNPASLYLRLGQLRVFLAKLKLAGIQDVLEILDRRSFLSRAIAGVLVVPLAVAALLILDLSGAVLLVPQMMLRVWQREPQSSSWRPSW